MKILKFGGSSLATPDRIRAAARIVLAEARAEQVIVVVSAFQGVTNQLIDCAHRAEKIDGDYATAWEKIARRHRSVVADLLGPRHGRKILRQVDQLLTDLRDVLHGIRLLAH